MSFIRFGQEREWCDVGPMYVYMDGDDRLVGLPQNAYGFTEIAMKMLDQSGELTDEELESAFRGFVSRMRLEEDSLHREVDP